MVWEGPGQVWRLPDSARGATRAHNAKGCPYRDRQQWRSLPQRSLPQSRRAGRSALRCGRPRDRTGPADGPSLGAASAAGTCRGTRGLIGGRGERDFVGERDEIRPGVAPAGRGLGLRAVGADERPPSRARLTASAIAARTFSCSSCPGTPSDTARSFGPAKMPSSPSTAQTAATSSSSSALSSTARSTGPSRVAARCPGASAPPTERGRAGGRHDLLGLGSRLDVRHQDPGHAGVHNLPDPNLGIPRHACEDEHVGARPIAARAGRSVTATAPRPRLNTTASKPARPNAGTNSARGRESGLQARHRPAGVRRSSPAPQLRSFVVKGHSASSFTGCLRSGRGRPVPVQDLAPGHEDNTLKLLHVREQLIVERDAMCRPRDVRVR